MPKITRPTGFEKNDLPSYDDHLSSIETAPRDDTDSRKAA